MLNTEQLKQKVKDIKIRTFDMVMNAGRGHLGGSYSSVECLVALYYGGILKYDPKNPDWDERDYLILSKGHANNCLCVILSDLGFFPDSQLDLYCQNGGILGGHSDDVVPGVEVVTGSLGHGLGLAAGLALGLKIDKKPNHVFCVIGDGESQEGSIWEALMFIAHHRLTNLTVIVDRNKLGSEEFTESTSALEPLVSKLKSFGGKEECNLLEIDGHNIELCAVSLKLGYEENKPENWGDGFPTIIIANTVKGNGMSVLENTPKAHHTLPKGDQIEITRKDLS